MILIGEKLNGFIPAMGQAIAARKESYVRKWARKQWEAGANYLDVCASGAEGELDALLWLMDVVQSEVDAPLSLDSPNAHVLEAAMRHAKRPALINSISLEGGKAQRLLTMTEQEKEYSLQLREMHQTQVDMRQNQIMKILTIVTTVFLPLSLIAGWYGMNFRNMPELTAEHGYLVICIVSVVCVLVELWIFKRKKWF